MASGSLVTCLKLGAVVMAQPKTSWMSSRARRIGFVCFVFILFAAAGPARRPSMTLALLLLTDEMRKKTASPLGRIFLET